MCIKSKGRQVIVAKSILWFTHATTHNNNIGLHMHDTSTYYTTYFFLNFPEKCTYYNKMVYIVLNDGHGIFGVIFFLWRVGSTSHFCPFLRKKGIIAP